MGDLSVEEKNQLARRLAVARNEVQELETALQGRSSSSAERKWKVGDGFRLKTKIYFESDGKGVEEGDTGLIVGLPEESDSIGVGQTTHPTDPTRCVNFDIMSNDVEFINVVRRKIPIPEKGLGISYKTVGNILKVVNVAEGSPGYEAGVKPGTTIAFLDDTSIYSGQDYKEIYAKVHADSSREYIVMGLEGEPEPEPKIETHRKTHNHVKHPKREAASNAVPTWVSKPEKTPSPPRTPKEPHLNPETGSTSSHGDDVDPAMLRSILKRNSKLPADRSHTPNGNIISDFSEPDSNDLAVRVINYIYNDMRRTRYVDTQFSSPQHFRPLPSEQLGIFGPPSPYGSDYSYQNNPVFDYNMSPPPPVSARRWSPPARAALPPSAYSAYLPMDML